MDAAELIELRAGSLVCWLRIADECSGAVLWTTVFPPARWNQVPPREVQAQLRLAFSRWGRPERLRVDNGGPWGSRGDLPTDWALWLSGLEVGVDPNPPARPQDNGVVERSQGTAKRWGEPQTCDGPEELPRRLEDMDRIQRQEYPSLRGRSRLEAYPQLAHSGRGYTPEWEEAHWSLAAVAADLAGYAVRRRVDGRGSISLYNRNHYIGFIHKRKTVYVMFDPEVFEWVVADEEGRQVSRQAATRINREDIMGLAVSQRDKER
jgi:hypothetical protein